MNINTPEIKRKIILKKNKKYFFNEGYFQYNACLSCGQLDYSEYAYIEGYFNSANILAGSLLYKDFILEKYKKMIDEDTGNYFFDIHKDTFIFPLMFNYRHYIELSLKFFIRRIYILNEEELSKNTENILKHHNIEKLSDKLIETYNKLLKNDSIGISKDEEFKSMLNNQYILLETCKELNKFDRTSLATRYPTLDYADNNPCYLKEAPINILNFANKMQEVRYFFEKMDFLISKIEEWHQEYLKSIY
jgi:hypothetical protein